jgi:peptidoglycan/LPS O-acetylase OafA/YrhL
MAVTGRPRLEVLDGLRFVAAMTVVLYHFTAMDRVWDQRAEAVFPVQIASYGWLGVYLFFLISGFVICMSSWGRGVGGFLLSRVTRLYPAYWLSVFAVTAVVTAWPYLHRPVGWPQALVNLTMFQDAVGVHPVADVYWTLWAELRFYLLFSLLVWWGLTYRRVVAFCVAWLGAATVARAVLPDGGVVHIVLLTDYAPLFTAGIACYLMYRFRPTLVTWGIVAASFALALPAALYRTSLEAHPGEVVPRMPTVLIMSGCFLLIAAVALGWLNRVRGRWLVVIGATTYPLYLLHLDLGGTLLQWWRGSLPPVVLVAVVIVLMVVLAWLVHRFVERPVAPLMKRAARALGARLRGRVEPVPEPVPAGERAG